MSARTDRVLIVALLDPDGQRSAIARAARRLGHRVVTATGVETALIVLGSLVPDLVIVRSVSPDWDREALARIAAAAPELPVRLVDAPAALQGALDDAPQLLN